MTDSDIWQTYGIPPSLVRLPEIRSMLECEVAKQDDADTELLKVFSLLLFAAGTLEDVKLIWRAKRSCFDAGMAIEVQLLCGAGLRQTKDYLASDKSALAQQIKEYIEDCESCGDFESFEPAELLREYDAYYKSP